MATNRKGRAVLRAALEWSRYNAGFLRDYRGWTLREMLEEAESVPHVRVYWGLWSDAELDTVIGRAR